MGAIPNAEVTVVTLAPQLHQGQPDNSLDQYVKDRFNKVVYLEKKWLSCLGKIPRLPLRPDRYLLLNSTVKKYVQKLGPSNFDVIVTRSQYHSAHGVGYALRQHYPDIPWIASFSDPWSGDIYERSLPLASWWSHRLEKRVMCTADRLIFPTAEMKEFVANQHKHTYTSLNEKSYVVPHSFDATLYKNQSSRHGSDILELGMFGSFYGPRSPDLFLQAIDIAVRKLYLKNFVVKVFGKGREIFYHALNQFPSVRNYVLHAGDLKYSEALSEMQNFDMLLLFDAPMPPPSIYLPSKLIDYLGAKRPLFAITPEGASADLVRKIGGWNANPNKPSEVASQLSKALKIIERGEFKTNDDIISQYAVQKIGPKLGQIIELVSGR